VAWQRSTGIHAGRPAAIAAMLGGMQGDERPKQSTAKSKAAAAAHQKRAHINTVIPANAGIQSRGVRPWCSGYRLSPV